MRRIRRLLGHSDTLLTGDLMSTTPNESTLQAAIDRLVEHAYAFVGDEPATNASVAVNGETIGEYSG
jgi:hypothetical protein